VTSRQRSDMRAISKSDANCAGECALSSTPWSLAAQVFETGLLQLASGQTAGSFNTWASLDPVPETAPLLEFIQGFEALADADYIAARRHFAIGLAQLPNDCSFIPEMILVYSAVCDLAQIGRCDQPHPGSRTGSDGS